MKASEAGARVHALACKLDALDRRRLTDSRFESTWAVNYLLTEMDEARREVFNSALMDSADIAAACVAVFEALDIICTDDGAVAGRHRRGLLAIRAAVARLALAVADLGGVSGARLAEVCACDTVELLRAAAGLVA